jgi:uncharacterized membrane protein YphA (DoxX/SURF4 family)
MLDAANFGELISAYGFDWLSVLAPFIIITEMMAGVCLVLRIYVRFSVLACIIMLLSFSFAYGYANFVNGIANCGCFGNIDVKLPVWATYLRNIVLFLLALFLWKFGEKQNEYHQWKAKNNLLIPFMAVVLFWTGHTWQLSSFYVNRLAKPHKLIGLEANMTPLKNYTNFSNDSTYVVWVFSYSCNGCINSIENIKQYQKGVADKFIALAVTDDKDGKKRELLDITFEPIDVGEGLAGFIRIIPTLLYIEGGKIKFVIEHTVPNVYSFKSVYLEMNNNEILNQKRKKL